MIMAVDRLESSARQEFSLVQNILQTETARLPRGRDQLFAEHVDAWRQTWKGGRVEVVGDAQLAKLTNFAQYYLLSALPAEFPHRPPDDSYHGCARSGLAKGGDMFKDYQGHVMWDSEMYVLPAVLPFHPETAKKMLQYRFSSEWCKVKCHVMYSIEQQFSF